MCYLQKTNLKHKNSQRYDDINITHTLPLPLLLNLRGEAWSLRIHSLASLTSSKIFHRLTDSNVNVLLLSPSPDLDEIRFLCCSLQALPLLPFIAVDQKLGLALKVAQVEKYSTWSRRTHVILRKNCRAWLRCVSMSREDTTESDLRDEKLEQEERSGIQRWGRGYRFGKPP